MSLPRDRVVTGDETDQWLDLRRESLLVGRGLKEMAALLAGRLTNKINPTTFAPSTYGSQQRLWKMSEETRREKG
jgi:hypothetical protein